MESGAANESFSDIFGTMIEFNAGYGKTPNYLIGEDYGTPFRSLANPRAYNNGVDYYGDRFFPGYCTPSNGNDMCGVHENNGIMNKAFYLLAVGGTHPYSGVQVGSIGRDQAASIFYFALTHYLTPTSNLHDIEEGTYSAAVHFNGGLAGGNFSYQAQAVLQAWKAVGIPRNQIEEAWFFTKQQYMDVLNRQPDTTGWSGWANTINGCGHNNWNCINAVRIHVARGFLDSNEFQQNKPSLRNPATAHEYNQEYVRQCYLVFLRRNPDTNGLNSWVNTLDSTGDYNHLVDGFINSNEYRNRFCCGG